MYLIALVILVAVILGALGYIYWNNFVTNDQERISNTDYSLTECIARVEKYNDGMAEGYVDSCISDDGKLVANENIQQENTSDKDVSYSVTSRETFSTKSGQETLELTEWGVKMDIPANAPLITYYRINRQDFTHRNVEVSNGEVSYGFISKRVQEFGGNCADLDVSMQSYGMYYGLIRDTQPHNSVGEELPTISTHKYMFTHGQEGCTNDLIYKDDSTATVGPQGKIEADDYSMIVKMFRTIIGA